MPRESAYLTQQKDDSSALSIMVLSWNMGNQRCETLEDMLPRRGGAFDIIALGLQEATWTESGESESKKNDDSCYKQLETDLKKCISPEFDLVMHNVRVQMQQFIFVRHELRGRITEVDKYAENTGFLHVFPNKGGLRVQMTVDGTTLSFISCHLTAHEGYKNCQMRNYSVEEILNGVNGEKAMTTHHTFFMGDMNYRTTFDKKNFPARRIQNKKKEKDDVIIDMQDKDDDDSVVEDEAETNSREQQKQAIFQMIKEEKWSDLLDLDELTREIMSGRVLCGFKALVPNFPPTFKRKRKNGLDVSCFSPEDTTNSLIREHYDEKRLASYTDRILTYSMPGFDSHLVAKTFESCEAANSSDHKPVIACFEMQTTPGLRGINAFSKTLNQDTIGTFHERTVYQIKKLKCRNLTEMDAQVFGGGSDPYVVLTMDPSEILYRHNDLDPRTKTISHNLNPEWDDPISFRLITNDVKGLSKNAHLHLTVWDYDVHSEDDLIGGACIAWADILENLGKKKQYKFELELTRGGLTHGTIEGVITMANSNTPLKDEYLTSAENTERYSLYEAGQHRGEMLDPNKLGCNCSVS